MKHMVKMFKTTYEKLIDQEIELVKKGLGDTFECRHIIEILMDSVNQYYPDNKNQQNLIKFIPNDQDFIVGDYVKACGIKKGFVVMKKTQFDPKINVHHVVFDIKKDVNGCILAIVLNF